MSMTSYLQKKLGDHSIGKASFTMPTTVYLALFTVNPGEAGSLAGEVSGGSYARIAITSLMNAFDSVSGIAVNASSIDFANPTANWGTIVAVGIMDALTVGNMLYYQAVTSRSVLSGSPHVQFSPGQLTIQLI